MALSTRGPLGPHKIPHHPHSSNAPHPHPPLNPPPHSPPPSHHNQDMCPHHILLVYHICEYVYSSIAYLLNPILLIISLIWEWLYITYHLVHQKYGSRPCYFPPLLIGIYGTDITSFEDWGHITIIIIKVTIYDIIKSESSRITRILSTLY